MMDQLAAIVRQLAHEAMDTAINKGEDPDDIAVAEQALADGDTLRSQGALKDGAARYKDALAKAESALS